MIRESRSASAVHTLPAQGPVAAYCCRAAGGTRSPWSARVAFLAAPGQVITIAAATMCSRTTK